MATIQGEGQVEARRRRSRTFPSRLVPAIIHHDSSISKAEHLGKRLAVHLAQFKKLLILIQTMPSHSQRQQAYAQLLDAVDRSEQSAVKLMIHDDEVALQNGRRRIGALRDAIQACLAGYTMKPQ